MSQGSFIGDSSIWMFESKNLSYYTSGNYKYVQFEFELKRRPEYHLILLLLPTGVLTMVQLAAFFMPPNMPERPAYSITVVLAMQVLVSSYSSQIPLTAEVVYLIYYIDSNMIFGALVTLYMLIMCRVAGSEKKQKKVKLFDLLFALLALAVAIGLNVVFFYSLL